MVAGDPGQNTTLEEKRIWATKGYGKVTLEPADGAVRQCNSARVFVSKKVRARSFLSHFSR